MGQYEKDKKELVEKIEQLEHKLKKAKQAGDQADVDKYSRKLADRRAKLAALGKETAPIPVTATVVAPAAAAPIPVSATVVVNLEDFLAGGGGGMAMAAMCGLLLSMALGDH